MVNKQYGWTMVELMVVITVIGIISISFPQIISQINKFYKINQVQVSLQQEARVIMDTITRNLREAQSDTIKIDCIPGQMYYSRINFITINNRNITYYLTGRTLRQNIDGNVQILSRDVTYLSFSLPKSYDLTIVSVAFTLEKELYELQRKSLHMASEKVRIMN
jgi:prepilin-type N-terminal cleavage/methylation domain-containing protein